MSKRKSVQTTFIYDGDCGVCDRTVKWLIRRGAGDSIRFARYQVNPREMDLAGLSEEDCRHAAWLVEPRRNGGVRAWRGAAGINRALTRLHGRHWFWRLMGWLYFLPGIRQLEDLGYSIFARNRHRIVGGERVCAVQMPANREKG